MKIHDSLREISSQLLKSSTHFQNSLSQVRSASISPLKTRIAPSPTGHLHLGHLYSLIWTLGLAEECGAEVILRFEDHDQTRCKPEWTQSILRDFNALGLDWLVTRGVVYQSKRFELYQKVLAEISQDPNLEFFWCSCSRKDLQDRTGQSEVYDLHCLKNGSGIPEGGFDASEIKSKKGTHTLRVKMTRPSPVAPSFAPSKVDFKPNWAELGPFLDDKARISGQTSTEGVASVIDRDGNWTYFFCVVVDDLLDGVNLIVRGRDLLEQTQNQELMRTLLTPYLAKPRCSEQNPICSEQRGLANSLSDFRLYCHHPLVYERGASQKLSKSIRSAPLHGVISSGGLDVKACLHEFSKLLIST